MTEKDVEKLFMDMMEEEKPDLWNRIEAGIEMERVTETKKTGFFEKLRNAFMNGSTFKMAAAACACCLVLGVAVNGIGLGSKNSVSTYSTDALTFGSNSKSEYAAGGYAEEAAEEAAYDMEAAGSAAEGEGGASKNVSVPSRKLIKTINMEVQTKAFDDLVALLKSKTEELGGYVESSSISGSSYEYESNRWANFTFRIPQDKTEEFLNLVDGEARVTSKNESVEDVTLTYVDIESRISSLKTEQTALLEMLEKAENLDDIISIQNELTNVRYELESYESQLKTYDNLIDYDTVTIYVDEVKEVTPYEEPGVFERIREGLKNSFVNLGSDLQNLFVGIIVNIPYIAVFFAFIFAVIFIIKKIVVFRRKK